MKLTAALFGCCISIALATQDSEVRTFNGFQVLRTFPKTQEQTAFLTKFEEQLEYDLWTDIMIGRPVDIMTSPQHKQKLTKSLESQGIQYELMVDDVQTLIEYEKVPAVADLAAAASSADHSMTWTEYHSLEDMYSYLDYLEKNYDFVTTESIGKTTEGRDMRVAKICKGGCGSKKAVWIDGGIHSREWVSPAAVTWMLRELVENNQTHPELTENLDWYILPCHNPDGYDYSRKTDRMWRKTRSDHNSLFGCMGVDANRNWGHHWNEGGSSNNKCTDTYHGPSAFSEPENVNVKNFIETIKDQMIFYNTVHSYSQLVLLPWSYTSELPDDYEEMYDIAMKGSDALTQVHGKQYEVGCIPCILYVASGSSTDWVKGVAGVDFAMAMELRDTGSYGFLLPADQIIPTAEEVWAFHVTVIKQLMDKN